MKKQFSQSECENIMEKFLEYHDETCISMYQLKEVRHILIVDVVSLMGFEIDQIREMNLHLTLFAEDNHIQIWLDKL